MWQGLGRWSTLSRALGSHVPLGQITFRSVEAADAMNRTPFAGKGAAFGAAYSLLVLVTVTCDRPNPQPTAPQSAALKKAAAAIAAAALPGTTDPQVFV